MKGKTGDFIVFSNGPGEISTWVYPVVERLLSIEDFRERYKSYLIVHPCQFGSGTEHRYAEELNFFDSVIGPSDYLKLLFGFKSLKSYGFKKRGIIVSLGGDLMHPVIFRFRSFGHYKLYAYTNNPGWGKRYERIFVRNEYVKNKGLKNRIPEEKLIVTGDLVYSSIKRLESRERVRSLLNLDDDKLMVLFMPGSRDFEVKYMLPVFLKVIEELAERIVRFTPYILKSPYVDYNLIEETLKDAYKIKEADVSGGRIFKQKSSGVFTDFIETDKGIKVPILEGGLEKWGEGVDLAVTLPGTNNIQLAYRGIPSLVVAALNKPEVIPIEGIAGLLKWIPGGRLILRKAVLKYVKKFPFSSLPNIYTNSEIFPELFGVIKTDDIIDRMIRLIRDGEIDKIKRKLEVFKLDKDPAGVIASAILQG